MSRRGLESGSRGGAWGEGTDAGSVWSPCCLPLLSLAACDSLFPGQPGPGSTLRVLPTGQPVAPDASPPLRARFWPHAPPAMMKGSPHFLLQKESCGFR